MRLGPFLFVALAVACLSGCDPLYGPRIYNDTDRVLQVTARLGDRSSEMRLDPHVGSVEGHKGQVLQSLVVVDNGQRREYGSEVLEPMLKGFVTEDVLVVIYEDRIEVRSTKEANREGFFRKR